MNLTQAIEAARNVLRFKHMSLRTEKSYIGWIERYGHWCARHPEGGHEEKVRIYLTHLAVDRNVSVSTQNQALNAIVFLYRHVLQIEVGNFAGFHPARQPRRLPNVLSVDEVSRLLAHLTGTHWMIGALPYGAAPRLRAQACQSSSSPLRSLQAWALSARFSRAVSRATVAPAAGSAAGPGPSGGQGRRASGRPMARAPCHSPRSTAGRSRQFRA